MAEDIGEDGRLFAKMYFEFIESQAFDNLSGNALKLYLRMRRYVCRARSGHSLCDFYIKGLLAVSGYLSQYADAFGVHKSSISRWLKELEKAQFIATYYRAEKGERKPNIWILGRAVHIEGSKYALDVFFADHDAMAQEPDERAAQVFDQSKGEVAIARMTASADFAVALTVAPVQRCVQQGVAQVQPSNRKDLIDKSNNPPPKKQADQEPPVKEEYVELDNEGYPSKRKRPLISYIERNASRKLTPNQQNKLAAGVPFHSPEYKSPCMLFEIDPLFMEYIDGKISWATGGVDGQRRQTGSLIAAIRNYDHEHYGWLNFKQGHEEEVASHPLSRFKTITDVASEEDIRRYEERQKEG